MRSHVPAKLPRTDPRLVDELLEAAGWTPKWVTPQTIAGANRVLEIAAESGIEPKRVCGLASDLLEEMPARARVPIHEIAASLSYLAVKPGLPNEAKEVPHA